MGSSQSKKRSAADAKTDEAADITIEEAAPTNKRTTADMTDLNIATTAFADAATSLGVEARSTAAIAEEARAVYEQIVETIDLSTDPAVAAAAAAAEAEAEAAAEQPIAVGNAAYLLTFLGFLAWLLNESGGKDKYCKTAVTRIADFLSFIGIPKTSVRFICSLYIFLAGFPAEATHLQLIHALLNVEPVDIEKFVEHLTTIRQLSPSTVSYAAWYYLFIYYITASTAKVYNTLGNLKEGHIWVTLHFDCRAVYSLEASQLYRMVEVRLKSLQRTYRKLRNAVTRCSASLDTCSFNFFENRKKLIPI